MTWLAAYTPYIDRRATLSGAANPYANEARVSIVGLVPNTAYDVQVTWTDPDGVTGGQPAQGATMTLTFTPPTGSGTIRSVTNDGTLATALGAMNPGDTVNLASGTYSPFTINRSGTAGAWIVIDCKNVATISGAGSQNVLINANFIIFQNCTLSASDFNGITISNAHHHILIQNTTMQNISRLCANGPTSSHYADAGIMMGGAGQGGTVNDIYAVNNTILSTSLAACVQSVPFNGPGTGIGWNNCTTCVFKGNTVTGQFRDAISLDDDSAGNNVDIYLNKVSGYVDDGIESKGQNVNTRIWGNVITADRADTCVAANNNTPSTNYGPVYIFRNTCRVTTSNTAGLTVFKQYPSAPSYYFHNSVDASASPGGWDGYVFDINSGPYVVLNNIVRVRANMIDTAPANSIFDYNIGTAGGSWVSSWGSGSTTYSTFALFRTATGQEAHGLNTDPLFADTALHLSSSSPAIDKGVVLNNFNDAASCWPASGAPDIGAFEVGVTFGACGGSGTPVPSVPTNLRIVP